MKPRILLLLFVLIPTSFIAQANLSTSQIFEKLKSSVVVVMSGKPGDKQAGVLGSGFVVDKNQVVTNLHAVARVSVAHVVFDDGLSQEVKGAVASDADEDLVVLSVSTNNVPPVDLGDELSLREGDRVLAVGAPNGVNLILTDGSVSSFKKINGRFAIQVTAPINRGNSGGPLVNDQAQVVGVASFSANDSAGTYSSVGISAVRQLLKSRGQGTLSLAELNAQPGPADKGGKDSGKTADTVAPSGAVLQIEKLIQDLNYREAKLLIDNEIALGRDNPTILAEKGFVECKLDNCSEASLRFFDRSILQDPGNFGTRLRYAISLINIGQFDRAISQAEAEYRFKPDANGLHFLASVYYFSLKFPDAKLNALEILKQNPNDALALKIILGTIYWSRPFERTVWKQYAATLAKVEPDAMWVHFDAGLVKFGQSDLPGAMAEYDIAPKKDLFPDPAPYLAACENLLPQEHFADCDQWLVRGMKLAPADPRLLNLAISISARQHHFTEAGQYLQRYKKVTAVSPEEVADRSCLFYYSSGDVRNAINSCRELVGLFPKERAARAEYGFALLDAGDINGSREQFLELEKLLKEKGPDYHWEQSDFVVIGWGKSMTSYYLGDKKGGRAIFREMLKNVPNAADPAQLSKGPLLWSASTSQHMEEVARVLR